MLHSLLLIDDSRLVDLPNSTLSTFKLLSLIAPSMLIGRLPGRQVERIQNLPLRPSKYIFPANAELPLGRYTRRLTLEELGSGEVSSRYLAEYRPVSSLRLAIMPRNPLRSFSLATLSSFVKIWLKRIIENSRPN